MKKAVINLTLSLAALLLSLVILEAGFRYYFSHHLNYDYEMWRYAAELKEPLASQSLPFHHRGNRSGRYYGVDISTNSLGMRDREVPVKQPEIPRVLFVGDSYTLGWGVPAEATFSQQLGQMFAEKQQAVEAFNLGVGNYNSAMEMELFKQKGLALAPDLVVLMYYINDVEQTPKLGKLSYWLQKHSYLLGYMRTKLKQLVLMGAGQDWLDSYYRKLYAAEAPGYQHNRQALQELISMCRSRNIRLLLVNIPDLRRLENYPFSYASAFIGDIAVGNRVPYLDLLPVFAGNAGRSLWVSDEDSHTNAKANRLAMEAVYRKITAEGLLNVR